MSVLRFCLLFLAARACCAQEKLLVELPAAFDPGASTVRRVKDQCALPTVVGDKAFEQIQRRIPGAISVARPVEAGDAKFVRLTIVRVDGIGGGGWTGPKELTVRADLIRGTEVLATIERNEESRGGILGPVTGTCGIFEGIAETLGGAIAEWLAGQATVRTP
jgi:hypothetical protein